jgi:glucose-6-phosphate-specific signal transduction histidine kinase
MLTIDGGFSAHPALAATARGAIVGIPIAVGLYAGLSNMHDRLAAVGGTLTILSAPNDGTRVIGTVPLDQ